MTVRKNAAFKPCDIRGPYPEVVNEKLFWALGAALAELLPLERLIIAGDLRTSTPSLMQALAAGCGREDAKLLWPLSTPAAYYVGRKSAADMTLVVTASHNPPRYNGLKLLQGVLPLDETEMATLEQYVGTWLAREMPILTEHPLTDTRQWQEEYCAAILRLCRSASSLQVVVDPGNGCMCGSAAAVLRAAGHTVIEINGEADGQFPGRGPDPTAIGTTEALRQAVLFAGADVGIAFDGDGDRVVFVDEQGCALSGDVTVMLLAQQSLKLHPDTPLVLEARVSRTMAASLARYTKIIWTPPGHAYLRRALLSEKACFAGEMSGHCFFSETGGDDGLFAALRLCQLIGAEGPLSTLVAGLPKAIIMREVRLPFQGDAELLLQELEQELIAYGQVGHLGGLIFSTGDAWAVIRHSLTEPILAVRCEAIDYARLRELKALIGALLSRHDLPFDQAAETDPLWQSETCLDTD